ncbi:MAG: hypothetical protein IJT34_08510 [Butyrivibrio sp.]|nr:hypothetical protein [Butyrivibrio sp.]
MAGKTTASTGWYRLDNAAKIIPSTARGANTRVFRITCELVEEVNPEILQQAVDETIVEFPYFNSILKRGLFWYYLEDSGLSCKVEKDHLPACAPLYIPGRKNLLYRINYYHRRINLEMFHVLADGTGGFMFFRRLVTRYLELAHDFHVDPAAFDSDAASTQEKSDDAFRQFYQRGRGLAQLKQMSSLHAHRLEGIEDENLEPHLLEGCVSASRFVEAAHQYGTTVGVLSVSVYIAALIDGMSLAQKKHPIVVSVPVNLRQFFRSNTARNFFGVINIEYYPEQYDGTMESITGVVAAEFAEKLSQEQVAKTMNSYAALERNYAIKVVPLFAKDLAIQQFDAAARRGVTTSISNMGQIRMPAETYPFIDHFGGFMTAASQQITICSFGDRMVFGEVSPFATHKSMLCFFRRLTGMGIPVTLATNDYDERPEEDV